MFNTIKNIGKIDDLIISQEIEDIFKVKKLLVESLVKIAHTKDCKKITIKELDGIESLCSSLSVIKNEDIIIHDNKEYS